MNLSFIFSEVEKDTETLEVQLWDWNRFGHPDAMGHIMIPIKTVETDGKTHEGWHKLVPMKKETVSGELRLILQYTSAKVIFFLLPHKGLKRILFFSLASC